MVNISPITTALRDCGAKAYGHNSYVTRNITPMKECHFKDRNGNYVGTLKRATNRWIKGHAYHRNYIEMGHMAQQRDFDIQFAKILGKNGQKDMFIPEKITKEFTIRDKNKNFTKEIRERVVSSKLKLVGEDTHDKFKIYEALEPIKYEEKLISQGPVDTP